MFIDLPYRYTGARCSFVTFEQDKSASIRTVSLACLPHLHSEEDLSYFIFKTLTLFTKTLLQILTVFTFM